MFRCIECGTQIDLPCFNQANIVECPCCGIDIEIIENTIVAHQLGLSEE